MNYLKGGVLALCLVGLAASWPHEQTNTWGAIKRKEYVLKFVTPGWTGTRGDRGMITLSSNNVIVQLTFEHTETK